MVIGVDTGFFIELTKDNSEAINVWDKVLNRDESLIVSVISLNELSVYFYRTGNIEKKDRLINLIKLIPNIELVPVTSEIAEESAKYRHSLGIPTVDSMILTTFILQYCKIIVATDKHFEKAKEQNLINVKLI